MARSKGSRRSPLPAEQRPTPHPARPPLPCISIPCPRSTGPLPIPPGRPSHASLPPAGRVMGSRVKGKGGVSKPLSWVLQQPGHVISPRGYLLVPTAPRWTDPLTPSGTPREHFPATGVSAAAGQEEPDSPPWSLWHRLVFQSVKPTPTPLPFPPSGAPRRHPASSSGPGRRKGQRIRRTWEERVGRLTP